MRRGLYGGMWRQALSSGLLFNEAESSRFGSVPRQGRDYGARRYAHLGLPGGSRIEYSTFRYQRARHTGWLRTSDERESFTPAGPDLEGVNQGKIPIWA